MKITTKLHNAVQDQQPYWSFEYFPPKTRQGVLNLFDRFERMYRLRPMFIDVTWGAGGSTSDLTLEICATAQNVYGLETCMHLTCTNMPRSMIDYALEQAKKNGIQNILALRGDPPRGVAKWEKCDDGFAHAVDLVRYIRAQYGDYFCIGVAGYPEGHVDSKDAAKDIGYLKDKVDAGADYVITQLFYDVDLFVDWLKACKEAGVNVPIIPGIMPIQSYDGFKRMITMCKTRVPQQVLDELQVIKSDDQAVREYGVKLAIDMCSRLMKAGVPGFHFYTLNLEKSTNMILEGLNFVRSYDYLRPLPWVPSQAKKREKENVRPIFWRNREESYISRTESWDEFPNGRWGDSRSPAYGELDGYGIGVHYSVEEALKLWGRPETVQHVQELFVQYVKGSLLALPWSDQPLKSESNPILEELVRLNGQGYLTINSQPAINGARSSDRIHGWGPKNGYVYQKAYLEFFVAPDHLDELVAKLNKDSYITYYMVNQRGDMKTNCKEPDVPNAVTWGVFPGKEIVQPTVVEALSFMAWKDEAFQMWHEWANMHEPSSASRSLLADIANHWYLVNVVHNDYPEGDAIFKAFE